MLQLMSIHEKWPLRRNNLKKCKSLRDNLDLTSYLAANDTKIAITKKVVHLTSV